MNPNKAYTVLVIILIIAMLIGILGFQLNFPIPWKDEASFIYQAISWSEKNTLFSESLSQNRTIMWMPPGYMITLGVIYKIFGISLELARYVSLIFFMASFLIWIYIVKKYISPVAILLVILFFILPSSLVSANVARMDVCIVFFSLLCYLAIIKDYLTIAFGLVLVGILYHFNMVYMSIPLLGGTLVRLHKNKSIKGFFYVNTFELLFLLISSVLFVCYCIYVLNNYADFSNDMETQFIRKLERPAFYHSIQNVSFITLLLLFATFSYFKSNWISLVTFLYSLALFLMYAIGQEMWYAIFYNISILSFFVGLWAMQTAKTKTPLLTVILILTVIFFLKSNRQFSGMSPSFFDVPYMDIATKLKIEGKILEALNEAKLNVKHKNSAQSFTISFSGKGNSIFFYLFAKKNGITLIHDLPETIQKTPVADLCIVIKRQQDPLWISQYEKHKLPAACKYGLITSDRNSEVSFFRIDHDQFVLSDG